MTACNHSQSLPPFEMCNNGFVLILARLYSGSICSTRLDLKSLKDTVRWCTGNLISKIGQPKRERGDMRQTKKQVDGAGFCLICPSVNDIHEVVDQQRTDKQNVG